MSVWFRDFIPRARESADILRTAAPQASTYARSRATTSSSATSGSRSVLSSSCDLVAMRLSSGYYFGRNPHSTAD